jgi:5-methylcytosine-specific restriction endonuclease McrA
LWICDCDKALKPELLQERLREEECQMQFVKAIRHAVQPIRLVVSESLTLFRLYIRSHKVLCAQDGFPARDWPWLRMHVLRRDGYCCRACHREGDEITLHVYAVAPLSLDASGLITLCAPCHRIVQNPKSAGGRIFVHIAG